MSSPNLIVDPNLKVLIKRLSKYKKYSSRLKNFVNEITNGNFLDKGEYTECYRYRDKYVIKITSSADFHKLPEFLAKEHFRKYFVPVEWVHPKGIALICHYVKIFPTRKVPNKWLWCAHNDLQKVNISLYDDHDDNVVVAEHEGEEKFFIIDYGCAYIDMNK